MDREVLLVRYETLAANRRHFEKLFFAVVAFSFCFSLAVWAVIAGLEPAAADLAFLSAGAILLGGAFIAYRLTLRERSAFDAMASSWREIAREKEVESRTGFRPGAMTIAVAAQGLAELLCVLAGAITLD